MQVIIRHVDMQKAQEPDDDKIIPMMSAAVFITTAPSIF
jgi:hypothetical protein